MISKRSDCCVSKFPDFPNWPGENHLARMAAERFHAVNKRGPNWYELVGMLRELTSDQRVAITIGINAATCGAIVCLDEAEGYVSGDDVPLSGSIPRDSEEDL